MAFALDLWNVPVVRNYRMAEQFFMNAQLTPWRKTAPHQHDDYPFPEKKQRNLGVRKDDNGDIIFRLHDTDVVRWKPDNTAECKIWASPSTCNFYANFLPNGIYFSCPNTLSGILIYVQDYKFPVCSDFTVRLMTDGSAEITPVVPYAFVKKRIKRKEAREVLKDTSYHEFCAWSKVMAPMLITDQLTWRDRNTARLNTTGWLEDNVEDKECWPDILIGHLDYNKWTQKIVGLSSLHTRIRESIYSSYHNRKKVYYEEWLPTLKRRAALTDLEVRPLSEKEEK